MKLLSPALRSCRWLAVASCLSIPVMAASAETEGDANAARVQKLEAAGIPLTAWPRFRGPLADGVAVDHPNLPETWSKSENVAWAADVPGFGWSCPVVWGDRVFITTVVSEASFEKPKAGLYLGAGVRTAPKGEHRWLVYCFDLNTGKELWQHEAFKGQPQVPRHPKSTYASETPATDGKRLYVLFGDVGLFCYDLDGKPVWWKKLEPRKTFLDYGAAASPIVHDGQVIVVYDNLSDSWVAAFDAETGDEKWKTSRQEKLSWATPFIWKQSEHTEIVVPGRNRNRAYGLDGKLIWEFQGPMSGLVIPSPFEAHGLCYITSGYVGDKERPVYAIQPGAKGDLKLTKDPSQNESITWYQPQSGPYNTSPIVYGDYYYTLYDRGFFTCHDARTGEEVYGKKRFAPRGSFTASPWAYNGKIFCLSEDGLTYVVKAGPEYELLGTNELDQELTLSSPAVAGDKVLIRTASKLYCIANTESKAEVSDSREGPGVPFVMKDGTRLLQVERAAAVMGWEAKTVVDGKLITLCQGGDDGFCVPIRLNTVSFKTVDGTLYVEEAAILKAMRAEAVDAGETTVRLRGQNAASEPVAEMLAYNAAWGEGRGFRPGSTLPDIPLMDLEGREVRFSQFLGKKYMIYCWASW